MARYTLILVVLPPGGFQGRAGVQTTAWPQTRDLSIDLVPARAVIHVHGPREIDIQVPVPTVQRGRFNFDAA